MVEVQRLHSKVAALWSTKMNSMYRQVVGLFGWDGVGCPDGREKISLSVVMDFASSRMWGRYKRA